MTFTRQQLDAARRQVEEATAAFLQAVSAEPFPGMAHLEAAYQQGADLDACSLAVWTKVIEQNRVEMVSFLIERGPTTHIGWALSEAIERGEAPMVRALLTQGVDANIPIPRPGHQSVISPLGRALTSHHAQAMVPLLLSFGARAWEPIYPGVEPPTRTYAHAPDLATLRLLLNATPKEHLHQLRQDDYALSCIWENSTGKGKEKDLLLAIEELQRHRLLPTMLDRPRSPGHLLGGLCRHHDVSTLKGLSSLGPGWCLDNPGSDNFLFHIHHESTLVRTLFQMEEEGLHVPRNMRGPSGETLLQKWASLCLASFNMQSPSTDEFSRQMLDFLRLVAMGFDPWAKRPSDRHTVPAQLLMETLRGHRTRLRVSHAPILIRALAKLDLSVELSPGKTALNILSARREAMFNDALTKEGYERLVKKTAVSHAARTLSTHLPEPSPAPRPRL